MALRLRDQDTREAVERPPTISTPLIALKPDCVVYNQMFANVDDLVRILEAGINVVTTSEFITGHRLGDGRERIVRACELGGSTISAAA
jgi:hypothetical protein